MEPNTKKYVKIGSIVLGSAIGLFAIYKAGKFAYGKYTDSKRVEWTAPDGSIVLVQKESLEKATLADANMVYNEAKRVTTKTPGQWSLFIQAIQKNMNRMEAQTFAGYYAKMKKNNDGKTVGLTEAEWKQFYKSLESLTK